MSNLIPFNFKGNQVRVIQIEGSPWFVAKDLCNVLEIAKTDSAIRGLDGDEKGTHSISTPGGNQEVSIVSESGMYSLVLTSRKKEAKVFKKWITSELLPTLRKTGSYSLKPQLEQETDELILKSIELRSEQRKLLDLKKQVAMTEQKIVSLRFDINRLVNEPIELEHHISDFVKDINLIYGNGTILTKDLFEMLKQWYREKGVLRIENGSEIWCSGVLNGTLLKSPSKLADKIVELYPESKVSKSRTSTERRTELVGLVISGQ